MAKINFLQDLPVSFFIYQVSKYSNTERAFNVCDFQSQVLHNLVALARFHAVKLKKEDTLTEKE